MPERERELSLHDRTATVAVVFLSAETRLANEEEKEEEREIFATADLEDQL